MKNGYLFLGLLLLFCNLDLHATTICEAPAPTFAQVTAVGNDHASVSWAPVLGAQSYLVSTTQDNTGFIIANEIVSGTSYTIDNLLSGEEYSISIRASYCEFGPFGAAVDVAFQTEIIVVDVILQSGCIDQINGVNDQYAAGETTTFELEETGCYLLQVQAFSNPQIEFNLAFTSLGNATALVGNFETNPANFYLLGNGPVNAVMLNAEGSVPLLTMNSIQLQWGSAMNLIWEQDVAMTLRRCSECNFTFGDETRPLISNFSPGTASGMTLELYPNPVQDQLNVLLPVPSNVEVWDLVGRKWATLGQVQPYQSYQLDVSEWPAGTYVVRWQNQNGVPEVHYFLKQGQ
ncbi:MAG: T9SS type A sorting domain-containing protein [Bacteroidota bacterium]